MKTYNIFLIAYLLSNLGYSLIKFSANGKRKAYELINTALISSNRTAVEVPDCNHQNFGKHITENRSI